MSFLTPSDPSQLGWGYRGIKCYGVKRQPQQYFAPPFLEDDLVLIPLCLLLCSKFMPKVNFVFENITDESVCLYKYVKYILMHTET